MTPSHAILAGSFVIAAAIVAAAFVLPERTDARQADTAPAAASAVAEAAAPRFQIVKVEGGMSWRLDTHTGEITVCRLENDRMVCARSTEAAELPKLSPQELEAQREARRQASRAERNELLDKFMAFFERIIRFAQEHSGMSEPPAPDDGETKRL